MVKTKVKAKNKDISHEPKHDERVSNSKDSSSNSQKSNGLKPLLFIIIILVAFNIGATFSIIIMGGGDSTNDINEKITRIDNFFTENVQGYGEGTPTNSGQGSSSGNSLQDWAQEAGDINLDEFNACLEDPAQQQEVQNDFNAGQQAGVTGTLSFFINGNQLTGAQPYSVIKAEIEKALENPEQMGPAEVETDGDPMLGNPDASVTVIEFSDYECPFCKRYWTQSYPQLKEEYIDTGKIKYVFRDFPLTNIHPNAVNIAVAANCVGEQLGDEGYFKFHDIAFANQ